MGARLRRFLWVVLVLGLIGLMAAGGVLWWAWDRLHQPFQGYAGETASVDIEPGMSATKILTRLETAGVIQDARLARLFLIHRLKDPALKAGGHPRFAQLLRQIARGQLDLVVGAGTEVVVLAFG